MKNWKTTLLGIFAGLALSFGQAAQARAIDPKAPPLTLGNVAPGLLLAALGVAARDHNARN